jgi:4-hydroxybenzoate polyprenyltransferase
MRPKQWTKNVFVWAALVFDVKLLQVQPFLRTLLTFILCCLISSAVYIINDLVDIERDRQHPSKRNRPLASGALNKSVAIAAATVIVVACLPITLWLDRGLPPILYGYLALMVAYSFWLKNIVIVDVLTIALGFVLRVAAGVVVVETERFSPWIYVCMVLLALFLALGKRRQEIVLMEGNSGNTRRILEEYTLRFVDEMLALVSASTVMAYALYTFSAPNLPPSHTMMLTVPFVLYGLFRYLYLIHVKGETEPPDVVVLKDRPLQIDVALFGLLVFVVFYVR